MPTLAKARPLLDLLAWPHGIDGYLELVDRRWSRAEIRARVVRHQRQTPDSITLTLEPNAAWRGFSAGQHVRLSVEIDGVRRTRCYSMANSALATDGRIELTAKVHEQGLVSTHLRDAVRPGAVLTVSEPDGEFTLGEVRPQRLVLVSGGSGITPVLSMLRTLCDEGHRGPVTLLHYSLDAEHVLYRHELAKLARQHPNVHVVHAFTHQPDGADLHGFFTPEHLASADPRFADAEIYVCGPTPLIDGVRGLLADRGLLDHLHVEQFTPPSRVTVGPADATTATGEVVFVRSGRRAPNTGATLLEQAEAAGLTPEYGCRMGICHTCTTRKVSGATRNVNTGAVDSTPDCDVQLCINVPIGDIEVNA